MPDPVGDDDALMPEGEWVELRNLGDADVNASGWVLYDSDDAHELYITSTNTDTGNAIIPSNGWLVVYRDGDSDFSLNQGADEVRLYDGYPVEESDLIDKTNYTYSNENISWARIPDGTGTFKESEPTPGKTNEIYKVSVTAEPKNQTAYQSMNATYTLTVTNLGNVADTIKLNITDNEAGFGALSADTFALNASENATAYLNVSDSTSGIYNTTVRATSQGNASVFDDVTVKTNVTVVPPIYNVSITSELTEQTTAPDVNATYTLTVTNLGNVADTIELNITENEADFGAFSADTFALNAGDNATAYLNVSDSISGIYNTTVRATSQGNASVFDDVTVKTNVTVVPPIYSVSITSEPTEQTTAPDVNATYTLTVTNLGNVADTIELNITENEAGFGALSADIFALNASENATAFLNVSDSTSGIYNTTVRATSQGNTSVFDDVTVKTNVTLYVPPAPTADSFGVEDASGRSGTYIEVPVNITNVTNGPVLGIRFDIAYDKNVINVTEVTKGNLVSNWSEPNVNNDFTWGTRVTIAGFYAADAIPNGSTGPVVLLNFSVIGSPGDMSPMNMTFIELSNLTGGVGTAPAKNGTFEVSKLGSIAGRITYACNGTGIAGVVVNLAKEGSVVNTTVTNETGYYNFTELIPDSYFVNASKPKFWDNSTEVTVIAGETANADMMLWLKGDLNNDCNVANIGDLVLMNRASVGEIAGDWRYDLNKNGIIADIGDVVLMNRASVGEIELL